MAKETASSPLLSTKLQKPRPASDLIHRARLLDRLDDASEYALTLVSGPAGSGKTSLVVDWVARYERPTAWLSLGADDSALNTFLSYLVAALRTIYPDVCPKTRDLLGAFEPPPLAYRATILINEIAQLPGPIVLVLDDYQQLKDKDIHSLIVTLIEHMPAAVHLVLVSRQDPPFPLARFRAKHQILELRANDLKFNRAESRSFLEAALGQTVPDSLIEALDRHMEGWVAGLRLASFALRNEPDFGTWIQAFEQYTNRHIRAYLLDEVLLQLPEAIRSFLVQTSILDQMCGPLCEELTGVDDPVCNGQAYLEWLEQANLFTISLDNHGTWFRYHHLFRDFLREHLRHQYNQTEINELHQRAGNWWAQHGYWDEAVYHFVTIGEMSSAAKALEKSVSEAQAHDQFRLMERQLNSVPEEALQLSLPLLLAQAWFYHWRFRLPAIPPLLETAQGLLDAGMHDLDEFSVQALQGEIDFFLGMLLFWGNEGKSSRDYLRRAVKSIPKTRAPVWGQAMFYLVMAEYHAGFKENSQLLIEGALYSEPSLPGELVVRLLIARIFLQLMSGELREAEKTTNLLHEIAQKNDIVNIVAFAHYLLGYIAYMWNDLEVARSQFQSATGMRYHLHPRVTVDAFLGLALTYQATGQYEQANETIDALLTFAVERKAPQFMIMARSAQARLALCREDLLLAASLAGKIGQEPETGPSFFVLASPDLIWSESQIISGAAGDERADLTRAVNILESRLKKAEEEHNVWRIIYIRANMALAFETMGRSAEAQSALEHSLRLALPGGYIRPFVDQGRSMANLLAKLGAKNSELKVYVAKLLTAYELTLGVTQATPAPEALVDPLTGRELEVLTLLDKRLSNKEIAAQLTISVGTVKQYTSRIYKKLNVHNRRQAVIHAYEVGILRIQ